MDQTIKYHLDENVDHAVAMGLRLRRIDVTTSTEARLIGAGDRAQLEFATAEGRVLVTHDRDFLHPDLAALSHTGIVYCDPSQRNVGAIVRYLTLMHACIAPEEMAGVIEFQS